MATNPALLRDLAHLTKFCHTGELESYHSMMLKYVPKRLHFSHGGMVARTQLAILDHNSNVGRQQATTEDGSLQFSLEFKKAQGQWRVRKVFTPSSQDFKKNLVSRVLECRLNGEVPDVRIHNHPDNIALLPRPDKADAILAYASRFGN